MLDEDELLDVDELHDEEEVDVLDVVLVLVFVVVGTGDVWAAPNVVSRRMIPCFINGATLKSMHQWYLC